MRQRRKKAEDKTFLDGRKTSARKKRSVKWYTKKWSQRCCSIAAYAITSLILLTCALCIWQLVMVRIDASLYPPRGKLIEISSPISPNKHFLHLRCIGERNGTRHAPGVSVILEAGLPFTSLSFEYFLQKEKDKLRNLDPNIQVCAYDRSGYGFSSPGPNPRTISKLTDELHRLLETAEIPPPYIFVGWSFGGWIGQLFTKRYFPDMAGLILVDSCTDDMTERRSGFKSELEEGIFSFNIVRWTQRLGFFRIMGALGLIPMEAGAPAATLPKRLQESMFAGLYRFLFPETAYQELLAFTESEKIVHEEIYEQKAQPVFRFLPLVVMTAESNRHFEKANHEMLMLSENHVNFMLGDNVDHYVPFSDPDAIYEAVAWVRKKHLAVPR